MKTHQKFNPNNIQDLFVGKEEYNFLEDLSLQEQKKLFNRDKSFLLDREQQELNHNAKNMAMKQQWSSSLRNYLLTFTMLMFITLWGNKTVFHLDDITLNFLITVGFAKVVGVVWLIVSHLFPSKEDLIKTKKSFAN